MTMMRSMANSSGPPRKPIPRATVRRVARTFGTYRWHLAGIALLVLLSAGLGLLSPIYLQTLINEGHLKRNLSIVTHYTLLSLLVTVKTDSTVHSFWRL
jgi:ABC-type bacteriocin/lantibiotic exporter with double-glycine peptidase domain